MVEVATGDLCLLCSLVLESYLNEDGGGKDKLIVEYVSKPGVKVKIDIALRTTKICEIHHLHEKEVKATDDLAQDPT